MSGIPEDLGESATWEAMKTESGAGVSILSLSDLRPGDIGFGPIDGAAGLLVKVGQLMLGERVRLGRVSIDHVYVVTDVRRTIPMEDHPPGQTVGPMAVEAMPGGARESDIWDRWSPRYVYVRPPYRPGQNVNVAECALDLVDTPYSFLDYAALAFRQRHLGALVPDRIERAVDRRVTDSGRMICSQLADQAMTRAGFRVFDDDRLSQDVTPGELFHRLVYGLRSIVTIPLI